MSGKKKLIIGITAAGSVGLLQGQMSYFNNKGYKTFLLSPESERSLNYCRKEDCELLSVEIEREISIFKDVKSLFKIIGILNRVKPDIVNLGTPKVALLGMIAAKLIGVKKRIYTCRGLRYEHEQGILRRILIIMEKITVFCSTDVLCISGSVRDLGVQDGIFPLKKTHIIHLGSSNGFDLSIFNSNSISQIEKDKLREKLNLTGYFTFGFLGRIIERKGIAELYDAFDLLYSKYNNIRLLIVGPIEESQIRDESIIEKIKTHPAIIWPGRTDDVSLHLSIMDVFVLPAWWEGFGNVLVQAAALGIPVISTFGTGTRDAVSNNFNGLLVPIKDSHSVSLAMEKLLENESLRNEYGRNGIIWSKNFENSIIWKGLEELYIN